METYKSIFAVRIACAIFAGRAKTQVPVTEKQARVRGQQVADKLPGLFKTEIIELK